MKGERESRCLMHKKKYERRDREKVNVGHTKRNMKGERESRCLIHKEKYKWR